MQLVSGLVFPRLARRNSKQQVVTPLLVTEYILDLLQDGSLIIPPVRTSTMHGHQHVNSQSKTSSLDHASQGLADLSKDYYPRVFPYSSLSYNAYNMLFFSLLFQVLFFYRRIGRRFLIVAAHAGRRRNRAGLLRDVLSMLFPRLHQ